MNPIIRKGKRNDLPSVYNYVKELAIFEKEPAAVTATLDDYYRAHDEKLIMTHIAELNGKCIGIALYYMTFSTWKGHMLYLEDFYVDINYRSSGVGQLLFDAYIAEAKKLNCKMVKWAVLDWNKKAVKFYERNNATIEKCWWDCKIIFE
ncbi:MAG: GNAT family N-acetyltransferase [Saprospiraceae bacterium]